MARPARAVDASRISDVRWQRGLAGVGAAVSVLVLGWLYLVPFFETTTPTPVGYDTPKYMWRSSLVGEVGLEALRGATPDTANANPDRPASPVLSSVVRAVAGISILRWSLVAPAVGAACTGLAAGALGLSVLREPTWAFGIYALVVGASTFVARTALGYADNLLLLPILTTVVIVGLRAARGDAILPGIVMMTAAAVTHWQFTVVFATVLLVAVVLLGPRSVRMSRAGISTARTPSVRIGWLLGGSAVTSIAVVAGSGVWPESFTTMERDAVVRKVADILSYHPIAPAAASAVAGAVILACRSDRDRDGLTVLGPWALVGLAGYAAHAVLDLPLPAHRLIGFSIAVPILGSTALVGSMRLIGRRWRYVGLVGSMFVGAMVLVVVITTTSTRWWATKPAFSPEQLTQVQAAGAYLQQVDDSVPVVFVIGPRSLSRRDNVVRAGLPPETIDRVLLHRGRVGPLLARDPDAIVVLLSSLRRGGLNRVEGSEIAPGVYVLQGPTSGGTSLRRPEVERAEPIDLLLTFLAALLLLEVAGSGWSAWAIPRGGLVRVGVAPAFGVAALILTGLLSDVLGLRILGGGGHVSVFTATGSGWIFWLLQRGRRDREARRVNTHRMAARHKLGWTSDAANRSSADDPSM